ncbi:MAG: phosphoribosyltransferase family protein [Bacillota bacterium]|nr:phosphoribosyltransferase [Bacillota bacterium]MDW7729229.1 phosphoribosyltransferase family protein [Bacillota bacterium]
MIFNDRSDAGERLAERLEIYRGRKPLILAVPRGGVVVAEPVFEKLGGDLDLIITRKIGAPHQRELAIGATSGDGFVMLNDELISRLGVFPDYIKKAAAKEQTEIKRRLDIYRGDRPLPRIEGRLVILVDDGVATGYTLLAALRSLQQQKPAELALAVPVGPPETLGRLNKEVDALVYLEAPVDFAAVGQFYHRFDQVNDQEVVDILKKAWSAE